MSERDTILMKLVRVKARDLDSYLAIGTEPRDVEPDLLAFGREVWDQAMASLSRQQKQNARAPER